ncbi:hypothetical protein ABZ341_35630 [Streptomyces sp. NPDC006173]|uniref:hypothetical protein n=1 Tax=Streptomyces sp. NPDC006173 TaxID=3155349 RepID=UPI0033EEDE49
MTIITAVAVATIAFGHNDGQTPQDTGRQKPPRQYSALYNQGTGDTPRAPQPHPSVSYPITFDTPKPRPKQPTPTVSYPIDFSTIESNR